LTEAYVIRVLLDRKTDIDDFTAIGVEFSHQGQIYTVKCGKETILSAGYLDILFNFIKS
jgi:hypothetical protein